MTKDFKTNSEAETQAIAHDFATRAQPGDVYCLSGPMGAGKSVFARHFIRTLLKDKDAEVPSPTFTLVQIYDLDDTAIWHFDLYRLEDAEEIYEIGWEDALFNNIVLIEWPERLASLKPPHAIDITINPISDTTRIITIGNKENQNV